MRLPGTRADGFASHASSRCGVQSKRAAVSASEYRSKPATLPAGAP